jgi:hypothetical protein
VEGCCLRVTFALLIGIAAVGALADRQDNPGPQNRVHQEVSEASSSRTLAAVGTRPDRTTFSSTTSPGVDMTP